VLLKSLNSNITFTNSNSQKDGSGAQVQRILSMIALCRELNINFKFRKLSSFEVQPFSNFKNFQSVSDELEEINGWVMKTFSCDELTSEDESRTQKIALEGSPTRQFIILLKIKLMTIFLSNRLLVEMPDSYLIANYKPSIYQQLHSNQRNFVHIPKKQFVNIHLHMRRENVNPSSERFLSIEYYEDILDTINDFFEDSEFQPSITVHTDILFSRSDLNLFETFVTQESLDHWQAQEEIPNFKHDFESNLDRYRTFLQSTKDRYANFELYDANSSVAEWESMALADILVIAKSSYGVVGGLLNETGLVIAPKFWMTNPPNWITFKSAIHAKTQLTRSLEKEWNQIV
jgi:hypothetical protein